MLRFALDENVPRAIFRGLRRRAPTVDVVRVQDSGLRGASDAEVLAWAARQRRVLVSADRRTLPAEARSRKEAGLAMPGVLQLRRRADLAAILDDLELLGAAGVRADLDGRVEFLPL